MEAVVLAAGSGARFGGGKLMAPWRGGVLLEGALQAAFAAPVRSVTVVTGADPRVASTLRAQAPSVRLVDAPDHAEGLAASLRAAVRAVPADAVGVLVLLGDMPHVPHAVLAPLCEAVLAGAPAAAPVWNGRRGNPVTLARELFPAVLALAGDVGARSILDRLGERLALVQAPSDGVLFDVDLPQDLARDGL
ncbi:nucleotidyltransferase family protein [Phenylobacterium deserti]|uniref:Nucleotidyltransferase family protein n=2 Tax=Phenylobacterium deserti TaxID=1914756 RepID=A0A328AXW2_9CAUL|nr:nucleotidyltransferase family protein [Phenylobacterium deserti]